jgi:hypothetical protein
MVSNLGETPENTWDPTYGINGLTDVNASWGATDFTTGSNAEGYNLDSVTLKMANRIESGTTFTVRIYETNPTTGLPGSDYWTLAGSNNPATGSSPSYTASGVTLAANTTYWVVAGVTGTLGKYDWYGTSSTNQTGMLGWDIGSGWTESTDKGASWGTYDDTGGPQKFGVYGTPVPEASTSLLFGLGLLGLVAARRWRRKPGA